MLALTLAGLGTAIRIYNYASYGKVGAVLFQPAASKNARIAQPVAMDDLPDESVRNQLLQKFAAEYLSVVPDAAEIRNRAGRNGALGAMASPEILSVWRRDILPELEKMAAENNYRRVNVITSGIIQDGDYWSVPVEMKTWLAPNNLEVNYAHKSSAELRMKIRFNKKIRDQMNGRRFDPGEYLDAGGAVPAIFQFAVDEMSIR